MLFGAIRVKEEFLPDEGLELVKLASRLLKEDPSCAKIANKNLKKLNEMRDESSLFCRSTLLCIIQLD